MPHLLALRSVDDPDTTLQCADWPNVLSHAGSYLHGRAAYAQASTLLRDARAISEKILGFEHSYTAIALHNLARLYQDEGDLAGAGPLFERALAIQEKVLGPEHPDTAISLNNLALLLSAKGDPAAGQPLVERALAITEKTFGPGHPKTAMTLNNLA